ncbi:hypothetical protein PR048_032278 [Dryococelus australis]|uniref:Uncharacterized protein n=1 Tax=Dryococelus australis TaxID=614101 RepID=A0ABQ9G1U2_9NEOP|nr:hypothetical protein PR048_032278 [Dryococelus australis]
MSISRVKYRPCRFHNRYYFTKGRVKRFWAVLRSEVLRADEVNMEQQWNEGAGGNGRSPRKLADQRHRPARFPLAKIRERPGRGLNPSNRSATAPPVAECVNGKFLRINYEICELVAMRTSRPSTKTTAHFVDQVSYHKHLLLTAATFLAPADSCEISGVNISEKTFRQNVLGITGRRRTSRPLCTWLLRSSEDFVQDCSLIGEFYIYNTGWSRVCFEDWCGIKLGFTDLYALGCCDQVRMEQRRNAKAGEMGDPRGNPPTNGIVWHDSHSCERLGVTRPGVEPGSLWWEASSLTSQSLGPGILLVSVEATYG